MNMKIFKRLKIFARRSRERLDPGFTVIESLVAVSILVLAVIGTTSAIQSGISSYILSKNQVTAFYLAQEGFEHIRNLRDENILRGRDWLTGVAEDSSDPCYSGGGVTKACIVNPIVGAAPIECDGGPGSCPRLRLDETLGFYGYDLSWPETIFRREIVIRRVNGNDHEVSVTVTVNWSKGMINRQFKATNNLFDW